MKATYLFLLSGCCMAWTVGAMIVKGLVGGKVTIKCTHFNARRNVKYLCKGECLDEDVLIRSRKNKGSDRYSIRDQGNTFFTTIKDLRLEDAGIYWCGIDRVGVDTFVKVNLEVKDVIKSDVHDVKETTTKGFKPTARTTSLIDESSRGESTSGRRTDPENESSQGGSMPDSLTYIGAVLGVAVLVLALVLLIFCRIKRRRAAFASDKNQGTNECLGDPRRNRPLPASLTNPHPDSAIYTNVSGFPKPHDQPEASESVPSSPEQPGVFYSTVICNSDSKGVALITDSDAVMYSTIKITQ